MSFLPVITVDKPNVSVGQGGLVYRRAKNNIQWTQVKI
jgi:hypothetical protein